MMPEKRRVATGVVGYVVQYIGRSGEYEVIPSSSVRAGDDVSSSGVGGYKRKIIHYRKYLWESKHRIV